MLLSLNLDRNFLTDLFILQSIIVQYFPLVVYTCKVMPNLMFASIKFYSLMFIKLTLSILGNELLKNMVPQFQNKMIR